jgi:hypothetical protein
MIQIRRLDLRIAVTTQRAVAEVGGEDEHDVGFGALGGGHARVRPEE